GSQVEREAESPGRLRGSRAVTVAAVTASAREGHRLRARGRTTRCRVAAPARGSSGVVAAYELRGLWARLVAGLLHARRHLRVRDEALPTLLVPVEDDPDPIVLGGIVEDDRALRAVLLALLGALRREDVQEPVEILDLRRCEEHVALL